MMNLQVSKKTKLLKLKGCIFFLTVLLSYNFIQAQQVTTFAGSGLPGSADGTGTLASFWSSRGVAVDKLGNVYVADLFTRKIRKINPAGVVSTLAGSGLLGSVDGTGAAASFNGPTGVAVDTLGNVYIADYGSHKIRKISPAGVVSTLAGSGVAGSTDATGAAASFNSPHGITVDKLGNVYVADYNNNKIRKISPAGVVSTFAGSGVQGSTDATGTAASFNSPSGLAFDVLGNVYVADAGNNKIRKISSVGVVTTIAGSGAQGSKDTIGTEASFWAPYGVAVDLLGDVYVSDRLNNKIRKISPSGDVTTFAGSGLPGDSNAIGTAASFSNPTGIAVDLFGNVYVESINRIRKIKHLLKLNTIRGKIYTDTNSDCIKQLSETPIPSVLISALPGPYYGKTDSTGNYEVKVDSGSVSYTLSQKYNSIQSKLLTNQCASNHNVALTGVFKDTSSFDFANLVKQCTILNITIQNSRMVRCFRNNTYVNYCNLGNAAASNAQIKIEYPDYLFPISSTPMWISKSGSTLTYDLGTIAANSCGKIDIIDSVVCNNQSLLGLTQCIKATISPSSTCITENSAWDKSSMKVTGSCINDSASFVIQNAGSGNMANNHNYRVYVNDTLVFTGTFILQSGEQFIVKYDAEGQTIRLEADQHSLHPGKSLPRATIENCGIPTSGAARQGLVTTPPQDDQDEEVAISCNRIRGSYDPNDKQTFPSGIGATKQVAPGEELEYTIRFQNTGTDTAYTVKIIDTIDTNLDVASFIQGVGSHPFTLQITGKGQAVLTFNFNEINLPDSTTNKAGSNGLVSYRITVPTNTPLGTVIKNKAYIYFDYNSPILTNETMHTVGVTVEEDLSKGSKVQVGNVTTEILGKYSATSVKIYPNPSTGSITVEIPNASNNMELRIISILGVLQKSVSLNNKKENQLSLEGIGQGMYVYELWQEGERKAGGMLQIR